MADKLPWFPFHVEDWLTHDKLRACSSAARGLWIDMLCLMHKNDRRGYLQLAGKPVTAEQLARMTGRSTDETSQQLAELLNSGVPSVTDDGIIYSRRMVKDERKRQLCSAAGKKGGGNPKLTTFKGTPKGGPKGTAKGGSKHASGSVFLEPTSVNGTHPMGDGGVGEGGTFKGQSKGRAVDSLDPDFDRFWRSYPRQVARRAAAEAWDELNPGPSLVREILDAIERQKQTDQWKRNVVPNPATWLRDARWSDVLPGASPPPEPLEDLQARIQRERAKDDKAKAGCLSPEEYAQRRKNLTTNLGAMPNEP